MAVRALTRSEEIDLIIEENLDNIEFSFDIYVNGY